MMSPEMSMSIRSEPERNTNRSESGPRNGAGEVSVGEPCACISVGDDPFSVERQRAFYDSVVEVFNAI